MSRSTIAERFPKSVLDAYWRQNTAHCAFGARVASVDERYAWTNVGALNLVSRSGKHMQKRKILKSPQGDVAVLRYIHQVRRNLLSTPSDNNAVTHLTNDPVQVFEAKTNKGGYSVRGYSVIPLCTVMYTNDTFQCRRRQESRLKVVTSTSRVRFAFCRLLDEQCWKVEDLDRTLIDEAFGKLGDVKHANLRSRYLTIRIHRGWLFPPHNFAHDRAMVDCWCVARQNLKRSSRKWSLNKICWSNLIHWICTLTVYASVGCEKSLPSFHHT